MEGGRAGKMEGAASGEGDEPAWRAGSETRVAPGRNAQMAVSEIPELGRERGARERMDVVRREAMKVSLE